MIDIHLKMAAPSRLDYCVTSILRVPSGLREEELVAD